MSTSRSPMECLVHAIEQERDRYNERSELAYHYNKMVDMVRLYLHDEAVHELRQYKEGFKDAVKIKNHEYENSKRQY